MLSMKNKYIVRSRISEAKFREILKYFCTDIEAAKIAKFTKISEVSLCKIFKQIRILMATECEKISKFSGEISKPAQKLRFEIDESYFKAKRVRGKRGRAVANKTPVFNFASLVTANKTVCLKEMTRSILGQLKTLMN